MRRPIVYLRGGDAWCGVNCGYYDSRSEGGPSHVPTDSPLPHEGPPRPGSTTRGISLILDLMMSHLDLISSGSHAVVTHYWRSRLLCSARTNHRSRRTLPTWRTSTRPRIGLMRTVSALLNTEPEGPEPRLKVMNVPCTPHTVLWPTAHGARYTITIHATIHTKRDTG